MARKEQTAARYEPEIIERIKALLVPMSTPLHTATISDVLRVATLAGLPILEEKCRKESPTLMALPVEKRLRDTPKPVGRRGGKREAVES